MSVILVTLYCIYLFSHSFATTVYNLKINGYGRLSWKNKWLYLQAIFSLNATTPVREPFQLSSIDFYIIIFKSLHSCLNRWQTAWCESKSGLETSLCLFVVSDVLCSSFRQWWSSDSSHNYFPHNSFFSFPCFPRKAGNATSYTQMPGCHGNRGTEAQRVWCVFVCVLFPPSSSMLGWLV